MAPKKKSQPGSTQRSIQAAQRQTRSVSREPSAEPQHQTRGVRKRRHSDASNISELASETQSAAPTPSKRRKRGKATSQAEAEHERLQEVVEEEDELQIMTEAIPGEETNTATETVHSKHVHFGAGDAKHEHLLPSDDLEATASHLTPHPQKMSIKRRLTASPMVTGEESQRLKRTSIRRSLPPSLSQQGSSQEQIIEEREFAPLSVVLQERMYELKLKHVRISALNNELASARLKKDIGRIHKLEEEIYELKEEHAALIASDNDDLILSADEDMYVLASQEELRYPELPQSQISHSQIRLSQVRSQEQISNLERKQLEDAVLVFSKQASDARASLELLQIQVRGLGFADENTEIDVVLQTIRESFAEIRDSLKGVLLETALQDSSNEDLLSSIIISLQDYSTRLRDQDQELAKRSSLAAELSSQVQGLIDRLAESELQREGLCGKLDTMDEDNNQKAHRIEELEQEVDAMANDRDTYQDELEIKVTEEKILKDENVELAKSIDRLTAALQKYREEETRLQDTITKMQEVHESSVSNMNREREETVRDLENQLDEECGLRDKADEQVIAQKALATALELKMAEIENERDHARDGLAGTKALLDEEEVARESAETELDERTAEVAELEQRVTLLEDDWNKLNAQLDELRQSGEAERTQREAAESELDAANGELEEVQEKLAAQGKQGNELRQKLYEVQQQNERKMREMEQASSERDEQFQNDIAHEVQRREAAEEVAQERDVTIDELNAKLDQAETEMHESITQRDERIETLEEDLDVKQGELETLRRDLQSVQAAYETLTEQTDEQREQLEASIASLQDTITRHEEYISSMQNEATATVETHNVEIEDRNAQIAELNHSVVEFEGQIAELTRDKAGLERRVEQEAEQMLEFQNEKQDEVEALKRTIRDKQAKIVNVEEKAVAADQRWQEFVNARDDDIATRNEEIALLREVDEEKTQMIATATADAESLRRKFREYVLKTNGKMKGLRDENAAFMARLERDGAELEDDGAEVLRAVDSMSVFQQTTVISTASKHTQEFASRNTRGRKKRVVDSGVGNGGLVLAE